MPNSSDGSSQLVDTLRLTDDQWQNLSEKIDRDDTSSNGQRIHPRVIYRKLAQIAVAIQQPNGEWSKYVVRSRNLSPGGIGFIHKMRIRSRYSAPGPRRIREPCSGPKPRG